jgi:hypothetical protein
VPSLESVFAGLLLPGGVYLAYVILALTRAGFRMLISFYRLGLVFFRFS